MGQDSLRDERMPKTDKFDVIFDNDFQRAIELSAEITRKIMIQKRWEKGARFISILLSA